MINKYLKTLFNYRFIIALLIILGLFSLTLYKLTLISQPQTDDTYLKQQQANVIKEIKIDPQLKSELEQLKSVKFNTQPKNLGQPDPFNP